MSETQTVSPEKKVLPESLKTARFSVNEGDLLKLRALVTDAADTANDRALVCTVRFFDAHDKLIEQAYEGVPVSANYGSYVYVESKKEGEAAAWVKEVIVAPAAAHSLEVKLYPWKISPAINVAGEVECLDIRRIPTDEISWNLGASDTKSETYEVLPFWRSLFSFEILKKANGAPDDIQIKIKFTGSDGDGVSLKTSVSSPVMGKVDALESDELSVSFVAQKCEYDGYERLIALAQLTPPATAVGAIVTVENRNITYSVRVSQRIFAFESLIESRLGADAGAFVARAKTLPADLAQLSLTRLAHKRPDDVSVFDGILEYYLGSGNIKKITTTANGILNRFQDGALCAKARRALACVTECSPSWMPTAACSSLAHHVVDNPSIPLTVAHFIRHSDIENNGSKAVFTQDAIYAQKALNGDKPFVILPLGYPQKGEQGLPWERHEVDGVTSYYLNCVSAEQLETIPVTTQLNFMSVLAGDILCAEHAELIHVHDCERGCDLALVGLALSSAMRIPLVYQKNSQFEVAADAFSTHPTLLQARVQKEYQCMFQADAVIVSTEAQRVGLLGLGIVPEKVFVWSGSNDERANTANDGLSERVAKLYRRVYDYAQRANKNKYM